MTDDPFELLPPEAWEAEEAFAGHGLLVIGTAETLASAHDEGLVVLASGHDYWVVPSRGHFLLVIEARAEQAVARQLELFREEQSRPRAPRPPKPRSQPIRLQLLLLPSLLWCLVFLLQQEFLIREQGLADAQRVLAEGEWWRAFTALTLHADVGHLAANALGWLLFGAFLGSFTGAGLAFFLSTLAGAAGNGINLWVMAAEGHRSLGASTALFAALGLQAGLAILAQTGGGRFRRIFVPIMASVALLALMGAGDETMRTDIGAHLWGFVCGVFPGLILGRTMRTWKASGPADYFFAFLTICLLLAAWAMALA